MGEIEKAKAVLDTIRQLPGLIFQEDLVIKRSSELYKNIKILTNEKNIFDNYCPFYNYTNLL